MNELENPYKPPSVENPPLFRVPFWLRIKRWIIGFFGIGSIASGTFFAYKVVATLGFSDGWFALLLTIVVICLGLFAMRIALRGKYKDVKEFNLMP